MEELVEWKEPILEQGRGPLAPPRHCRAQVLQSRESQQLGTCLLRPIFDLVK